MVMSSSMIVLPKGVRSRSARVRLEGKLSRRFGSCWKLASGEKCDAPRQLTCVMFYPGIEKCCGKRFELWGSGIRVGGNASPSASFLSARSTVTPRVAKVLCKMSIDRRKVSILCDAAIAARSHTHSCRFMSSRTLAMVRRVAMT
jgi:hypothetical protein